MSPQNYEPLLQEKSEEDEVHIDLPRLARSKNKERTAKILLGINAILTLVLLSVSFGWWHASSRLPPLPPHSPAYAAVKLVNKRFSRQSIFRSMNETSAEVDEAWKSVKGPSDGIFKLPESEARYNPPSSEIYYEAGNYIYGLAMFHQMHCLDTIRKSFYPEHYFPNETADSVRLHKNHCLDVLRQTIMCYGDTSLVHWWNNTYTEPHWNGRDKEPRPGFDWTQNFSPSYRAMTGKERAYNSDLRWDALRQCRDFDSLHSWVEERQVIDDAFRQEFKVAQECIPKAGGKEGETNCNS